MVAVKGKPKESDKDQGSSNDLLNKWLAESPGFQQLWDDLLSCCDVPFCPVTLEDGKDTASVYGMCLLDIGPDRLVAHARTSGWRPGAIKPLLDRCQLRKLIEKADAARNERKAKHYSAAKKREDRRHIPESFRSKWSRS